MAWVLNRTVIGVLVGSGVGILTLIDTALGAASVLSGIFIFLLFRRPELALAIAILFAHNLFGMITEETFRFPGLFKARDLLLFSLFIPFFIEGWRKGDLRHLIDSPISKCVMAIFLLSILIIIKTVMQHETDVGLTIRDGRRYFYYMMFFAILYNIRTAGQFKMFVDILIGLSIIYSCLVIAQFLLGPNHIIFLGASNDETTRWKVVPLTLAGITVARSYISGFDLTVFSFGIVLYRSTTSAINSKNMWNILILSVIGLQILLSFARAYWIGIFVAVVFSIFFLYRRVGRVIWVTIGAVILLSMFLIVGRFVNPQLPNPLSLLNERLEGTAGDLLGKEEGSFRWRMEDNAERLNLVKKNLLMGVGFVHDETKKFTLGLQGRGLRTADSGVLSVFIDMGLIGAVLILLMITLLLYRCYTAFKRNNETWENGVLYGCFIYVLTSLVASFTWPVFVSYETIVPLVVVMSAQEIIFRQMGVQTFAGKRPHCIEPTQEG